MEILSPFKKRKVNSSYDDDDVALLSVTSPENRSTDLKVDNVGTEISKLIEKKLSEEKKIELLKSPRKKRLPAKNFDRKITTAKMPPADEIEEFFSVAEKYDQKRFLEKYNFDVVKDVPVEGHYKWIQLKP